MAENRANGGTPESSGGEMGDADRSKSCVCVSVCVWVGGGGGGGQGRRELDQVWVKGLSPRPPNPTAEAADAPMRVPRELRVDRSRVVESRNSPRSKRTNADTRARLSVEVRRTLSRTAADGGRAGAVIDVVVEAREK